MKTTALHIIGILILGLPVVTLADSMDLGRFTTYPSYTQKGDNWLVRDVRPGESYREFITLENLSSETIILKIEIIESTGQKPQITLLENQPAANAGLWIVAETEEIALNASEKRIVGLDITIPKAVDAGEYQAVALVSENPGTDQPIGISARIGTRIYLNVTGAADLRSNTLAPPNNNLHIALIILSVAGIIYGTLPHKQKSTHHYGKSKF